MSRAVDLDGAAPGMPAWIGSGIVARPTIDIVRRGSAEEPRVLDAATGYDFTNQIFKSYETKFRLAKPGQRVRFRILLLNEWGYAYRSGDGPAQQTVVATVRRTQ